MEQSEAFWVTAPGLGGIRPVPVRPPAADEVLVRTRHTAVSRGTELLVWGGRVPPDQAQAIRAPHPDGDFPAAVKYGYLNIGVVEVGPPELRPAGIQRPRPTPLGHPP